MSNVQISMSGVSIHRMRTDMLSELVAKLVKAGGVAKEKVTKEMIAELKKSAAVFTDAKTKEKTTQTTVLSQQYLDTLKKRYTALNGCLTTAKNSGIEAQGKAAAKIEPKFVKITTVFALKSEAISKLENVLTSLKQLPAEDFKTIGAAAILADIESIVEEYRTTINSRVDVKVDKSKAVVTARDSVVKNIQKLLTSIKYAQDCLGGSETELVKSYNTIFAETAATIKFMATVRAKKKDQ